jgi:WD40 repeat protein
LSPDGRYLGTAEGSRVHVTDLHDVTRPKKTFFPPSLTQEGDHDEDVVLSMAVDSVGGLVYFATRGLLLYQFDLISLELKRTFRAHDAGVLSIVASLDGGFFVTGSADGTLKVWRSRDASLLHVLRGHSRVIRAVCLSNDDGELYSGSDDGNIRLWDLEKGTCLAICKGGHSSAVTGLSCSPCGQFLVSVSRD